MELCKLARLNKFSNNSRVDAMATERTPNLVWDLSYKNSLNQNGSMFDSLQ